jgi:hypothetical protein
MCSSLLVNKYFYFFLFRIFGKSNTSRYDFDLYALTMSINKEEDVEAAMSNIDLGSKKASPGLANTLTQLNWIEKMKAARLERKSTNKSSSSSEYSPEAPQPTGQTPQLKPKVKTYRRSSFSALIHHTPILAKRSVKKKHVSGCWQTFCEQPRG